MYVVKYDDDWEKLKEYVKKREPYSFAAKKAQEAESVAEGYKPPPSPPQGAAEEEHEEEQEAVRNLLSMLEQTLVKRPEAKEPEAQAIPEAKPGGFTFKAPLTNDVYTAIAKMTAEPGETGGVLGKFKVADVDGERAVVAEEPLTMDEFMELYKQTRAPLEGYIEDQVYMLMPDDLNKLMEDVKSVKYYSRNAIMIKGKNYNVEEDVLLEFPVPFTRSGPKRYLPVKVKAYVKAKEPDENSYGRSSLITLEKIRKLGSCEKEFDGDVGDIPLFADIVKTCLSRGARNMWIVMNKVGADNQNLEELGKMLGEMLGPLGFKVYIAPECRNKQYINTLTAGLDYYEKNVVNIGCRSQ
jgi:hypothetical protein